MSYPTQRDRTCSACGAGLVDGALHGLCPKCLLRIGFELNAERRLRIRCPQCHVAIEIVDDASLKEVTCPSCDSRFSLVGDQTATFVAERGGRVGQFELLERVGMGAFGAVWKARDLELDRTVAVKIPRKEQLSDDEAEQFLREARSAAQLRHPGIVSVHEVGRDGDRLYIVSDYIEGITLADALSTERPSIRDSARLCRQVAEALQHAHARGVVHRDLKPSNIMLDDTGCPHVMDFGLAKRDAAEITVTIDGHILGTPAYMSPEQARGEGHHADARSDIYSLGVILFELITGEKPFRGTSRMLLHQVLHDDAPSPHKFNGKVPRDLETICLKCLEKDPGRRFASAHELANELERFHDDRPIQSRPITRWQRGWRWCRRNPVVASLVAAVAASLLVGLASTSWQWRTAQANFDDATEARSLAERRARETTAALNESQSRLARVFLERGLQKMDVDPHAGSPWLLQALRSEPENSTAKAMHRLRMGLTLYELPALAGFWPSAVDAKFSRDGKKLAVAAGRTAYLCELPTMRTVATLQHDASVAGVYFTPQGDRLATVAHDENGPPLLRIWDAQSGGAITEVRDLADVEYGMRDTPTVAFTLDGDRLVAVMAGLYNRWHTKMTMRVFDSQTLLPLSSTFAHHSQLDLFNGYHKLSPDALHVLVPQGLPADDPRVPWEDGNSWTDDMQPQQYDLLTGKAMHPPLDHELDFYAWNQFGYSRDGSLIATSASGSVKIWRSQNGELAKEFKIPENGHEHVQFHPDGKSLFASVGRSTYWWDIATGELKRDWAHTGESFVSPTGQYAVYTDSGNGSTYIRDITDPESEEHSVPEVYRVTFSPDGSRFMHQGAGHYEAGVYVSPPPQIYRSVDGAAITPPWRFNGRISEPFTANGRFFLTREDAGIWLWDLDSRRQIVEAFPPGRARLVIDAAFSRDDKTIAILTDDCIVSSWDSDTGERRGEPFQIPEATKSGASIEWEWMELNRAADAADKVAIVGQYRDPKPDDENRMVDLVQVWDLNTGQAVTESIVFDAEPSSSITTLQFVGNGLRLAMTERLHPKDHQDPERTRLHIYNLALGAPSDPPREFEHSFDIVDVTAHGDRCLVVRNDDRWGNVEREPGLMPGAAQIYSANTWQPLSQPMTPRKGRAWNAALSPDGTKLLMGDGEVWDVPTGTLLVEARLQHRSARQFIFSRDGTAFFVLTEGGTGSWDDASEVQVFSTLDGKPLSPPMANTRIDKPHGAVDPERNLVVAAGRALRIWDAASGTVLSRVIDLGLGKGLGNASGPGRAAIFSPNGQRIYVAVGPQLLCIRLDEIKRSIPPDDVLDAWAGILSGERVDVLGGIVAMSAADYQQAWQTVQTDAHRSAADSPVRILDPAMQAR